MLSAAQRPPVEPIIDAGFLPVMIAALGRDECPDLQFEAAWALTNVA